MKAWTIRWTEAAARDLGRLDPPVARRVIRKLEQTVADPDRFFGRLASSEDRKLRIGDFRLLALLDPATRTILVERVDHRRRIYR
ncbi:MAG: type II toxin-antitoxin system RelE family toxin [Thermoplasmata archaeon]